jgi:hypothetical protein
VSAALQLSLATPAAGYVETDPDAANALLTAWGHYLGRCDRPFGSQAWRLDVVGEPVSIAVSASTVSPTVAGYQRGNATWSKQRPEGHPARGAKSLWLWKYGPASP